MLIYCIFIKILTMNRTKETFILGFAIFAGFFGAGNLILPPMLGFKAGPDWWLVAIGFLTSATVIPLLALIGHARLQGTMIDFGRKVSDRFGLVFSICIYIIAIVLPTPRTAAVTYEMAIQPYFGTSSLISSSIYFSLVFLFVINRGKVIDFLGKFLTPIIGIILLAIIVLGIFGSPSEIQVGIYDAPFISGFLEGYQTYDAIGGLLMGGIMVISVNNAKGILNVKEKQRMIAQSGGIAMLGLFIIYIGLIFVGSKYNASFESSISRTGLLTSLSSTILGKTGASFLSVLVALACFTTAVSIIIGTADFFKGLFLENSRKVYTITAAISCLFGILIGQYEVKFIIDLAVYVLMLIYPIGIVLILLNLLPEQYASRTIFRIVVLIAFVFSIPDFLKFLIPSENLEFIYNIVPFSADGMGWVIPSVIGFIVANIIIRLKGRNTT